MKRLLASILAVAALAPINTASAVAPALDCTNPTVLTSGQGGIAFPGGYRVNMDHWTGPIVPGSTWQKMWVCDQTDWSSSNLEDGPPATGVKTYPASEFTTTDWWRCSSQPRLDSFTRLKSTYSGIAPAAGSWDFAADLFIGSGACPRPLTEVMAFYDWRDVDLPRAQLHPTIDGIAYDIYWAPFTTALLAERVYHRPAATISPSLTGGNYIQMRLVDRNMAGATNWKRVFRFLERKGLLVMSDTLMFLRTGYEVLSTCTSYTSGCQGVKVPFVVNGFTVAEARA